MIKQWVGLSLLGLIGLIGCGSTRFVQPFAGGTARPTIAPPQSSTTPSRGLHFVSGTVAWGLKGQTLVRTTDGAQTWNDVTPQSATSAPIASDRETTVLTKDADHAYVVAMTNTGAVSLSATSNGGQSWSSTTPFQAKEASFPEAVEFLDPDHGWVLMQFQTGSAFSSGEAYGTSDAGKTWTKLVLPAAGSIRFASPLRGWLTGGAAYNQQFITSDGGSSWTEQHFAPPASLATAKVLALAPPRMVDSNHSVMPVQFVDSGDNNSVDFYVSNDGGVTWTSTTPQSIDPSAGAVVQTADVIDQNNWVFSVKGKIYVTNNAGASWSVSSPDWASHDQMGGSADPNAAPSLSSLSFTSVNVGWAILLTEHCSAFKQCKSATELVRTDDGGRTWN